MSPGCRARIPAPHTEDRMGKPFRQVVAWLVNRLAYVRFRMARRRTLRKAQEDDPNIYPLW
jgi:hypothetical protein